MEIYSWQFQSDDIDDLKCSVCMQVVSNATFTACQHSFCHACITTALSTKLECPNCREYASTSGLITALFLQRKIASLRVCCVYREHGCSWKGSLGAEGKDYFAHMLACPCRGEKCKDCEEIVGHKPSDQVEHDTVCPRKVVDCTHCKFPVIRCEMTEHFAECGDFLLECEYKWLGIDVCQHLIARKNLSAHRVDTSALHLSAMKKKYDSTVEEHKRVDISRKRKLEEKDREISIIKKVGYVSENNRTYVDFTRLTLQEIREFFIALRVLDQSP